jgi:hypothetical protein
MADDKSLDVVELPEDLNAQGKSSYPNVEATVDEVDIARIERIYK